MVAPALEEDLVRKRLLPNPVKIEIVVSAMRHNKMTCQSHLETLKWLSEWSMPLKHSQDDASGAVRWDIGSVMRSVKCMTLSF